MESLTMQILIWVVAVSSGLMSGTYLAFSAFIMRALDDLETGQAVTAMNAINTVILKSVFMPLFFGSTLAALLLTFVSLRFWAHEPEIAALGLAAGVLYVVGMFVITAIANVPLNNQLLKTNDTAQDAGAAWQVYRLKWTRWNTVRTVASTGTVIICLVMLSA
ncbi:MAG: anthrone oxygenase family protein [Pseudomonadota bacterium]